MDRSRAKTETTTSIKSSHSKCLSLLCNGVPESLAAAGGGGRHSKRGREAGREVKWASVSGC